MKIEVLINIDLIGFHYYPTAPKKVEFLKYNHRHIFNIKAGFEVKKLNREIEIFTIEEEIKNYLYEEFGSPCNFKSMSCEMIAKNIFKFCSSKKCIFVEVLEDNKGGAVVRL